MIRWLHSVPSSCLHYYHNTTLNDTFWFDFFRKIKFTYEPRQQTGILDIHISYLCKHLHILCHKLILFIFLNRYYEHGRLWLDLTVIVVMAFYCSYLNILHAVKWILILPRQHHKRKQLTYYFLWLGSSILFFKVVRRLACLNECGRRLMCWM